MAKSHVACIIWRVGQGESALQTTGASSFVRGGAFNNNQNNARCAYRNRNQPDNRNNNIGFRVCVSTDLLDLAGNVARLRLS